MIRKHTCKVETRLRVCFNYPQSKSTTYQAALPNHPLATAQTTVPQTLRLPASVSRPSAAHSKLCLCSSVQDKPQITSRLSWPRQLLPKSHREDRSGEDGRCVAGEVLALPVDPHHCLSSRPHRTSVFKVGVNLLSLSHCSPFRTHHSICMLMFQRPPSLLSISQHN